MSQQNLKLFTRINSYIILSKLIKPSMSTLDSGIGSLDMSPACSDEEAVRRLFVFLKDNLIFESLQDGLMQKKLLNEREKEDYVCSNCARHYWSERLIKLIIRKKKCKEFVAFMHQMSCHKHVSEKILEVQKKATEETQKAANGAVQRRLNLTLTHELLQRHFACLYMELEPREIMDEMFQAGHLTVFEHDNVTEFNQRHKRLSCLLVILRKKNLYAQLVCTLQSLGYMSVLDTLQKDRKLKNKPSEYSTCIQHNFILLQEDIPGSGDARLFMEHELDQTNISDIESCKGAVRKISKLLKILLIRGKSACKEFFRVVEVDLKMEVLIQKMKYKSAEIKRRGRPNLNQRHRSLKTSCLQEHEEFLNEELEPLDICDLLFEERAMEISAHDKITETSKRQKQMKYLLATVNENENDCFYFFLYILQKEGYESILEELKKSTPGAVGAVPHEQSENLRLSLRVEKEPDDVGNEDIQMRLSVGGHNGQQVEQALQDSHSSGTGILEEAILHGAVDIWGVSSGSIVLQLRPVTDQAVQTLLNVRDNNRLVEMIVGMLKKVNIASMMDGTEPLEIKVQVYKANPVGAISKAEDAELIKKRLKAHRNVLVSELEPRAIAHVLSKSKAFPESAIDSVLNADSCNDRVEILMSLVEDGESEVVKEFVTALKDLGYSSIVELIDPPDIHNRAENIRKMITSNYKNILEEMQMKLAKETLSKCVGDVNEIREKILPKNGNRKKRMSSFLQFILQDDHNVIEFEKMLRNNDLEDLLKIDENVQGEHIPTQGIEMTFVEDQIHSSSEGVLFEAVITLSHTVKSDREIKQKVSKILEKTKGQQGETGTKQLHTDFEKMHLDESPSRPQRLDRTPTSPDIPLKGNESISSVSSSTSLKSIISDAEEDKSTGKTFTKNVPSLNEKKNVVKTLGHEERFDPQKEVDLPSPSQCTRMLVAAIDFGTVYSGYAYSFKAEWPTVKTNIWSGGTILTYKTPSVLLLNPDQSFNSFGYDAEMRYACLKEDDKDFRKYFFFQRFKMILKSSLEKRVHRKTQCIAENGSSVDAMKVFTHCINHMRKHLLKDIEKKLAGEITMDDIDFVLTVPGIWDDTAKMFMREAAVDAGIKSDQLLIALESEAASIYCQLMHLESNENKKLFLAGKEIGANYMVLDLGGGTADITIHQLKEDGSLAELVPASGGSWGGTCIDKAFEDFLTKVFGETVMKIFKTDPEYSSDYFYFWTVFEFKKRQFETKTNKNVEQNEKDKSESRFAIQIPLALTEIVAKQNKQDMKKTKSDAIITNAIQNSQYRNDLTFEYGKLFMKSSFFIKMFNPTTELIINHLKKLYRDIGQDLKVILMVGGFSECSVIQEAVKKEFEGKCRVVIPNQAGLAVVKGAVYFGHQPNLITERVSRYTYGIQTWPAFNESKHVKSKRVVMDDGPRCKDVFFKFVAKGDKIKPGDKKSYILKSMRLNAKTLDCRIFISNEKDPKYVDDEGCAKLGTLTIPLDGIDRNVDIEESLIFGYTELHVTACNCTNKMEYKVTFDLLSEKNQFILKHE